MEEEAETESITLQDSAAGGRIDGKWGYIWGAYSVTWVLLVGYTLSLVLRGRLLRRSSGVER
ncbi:MAG: hypothetical protein EA397_20510 [Deltaproteobacteria bacterium]|nr:MAG: hypothetical protein EA397_20510 [Deltaproteobacteria bacterium]